MYIDGLYQLVNIVLTYIDLHITLVLINTRFVFMLPKVNTCFVDVTIIKANGEMRHNNFYCSLFLLLLLMSFLSMPLALLISNMVLPCLWHVSVHMTPSNNEQCIKRRIGEEEKQKECGGCQKA